MDVATLNSVLAMGTIGMQAVTAALVVAYLLRRKVEVCRDVVAQVRGYADLIVLALAGFGSVMTLYYSEILGFEPCPLCWWQRIFLYPIVVLFAVAMVTKDTSVRLYSIVLSILGLGVALYHHALQMLPEGSLPCPAEGVSCAKIVFLEFGYVTYPMMAVALFTLIIVLMTIARSKE